MASGEPGALWGWAAKAVGPGPEPTDAGASGEATMQLLTLNSRGSVQILLSVSSIGSLPGKSSFLFVIIKCSSIFKNCYF